MWRERSGRRYFAARDAGITGFSHIGLNSTDPARDELFWTQVCNARVSDRIGDIPLMRVNAIHHTIALVRAPKPGIQHVNHQVECDDDVLRSYYFLSERRVPIVFGPGRHPTSGARFLYFTGPDGMVFEYSVGVDEIEDEATHRPRQFGFEPTSFCMWGSKPAGMALPKKMAFGLRGRTAIVCAASMGLGNRPPNLREKLRSTLSILANAG